MRIVIDMQGAQTGSRLRGIGRYSMALARAMVQHRGAHEIILLLNGMFPETIAPIQQAFRGLLPRQNIRVWHALGPVATDIPENQQRRQIAQAIREDVIRQLRPDVLHITSLFEGFGDNATHTIPADGHLPLARQLRQHPEVERLRYFSMGRWVADPLASLEAQQQAQSHVSSPEPGIALRLRAALAGNRAAVRIYQSLMPAVSRWQLRTEARAIFHSPNYLVPPFPGRTVNTVHDLSHVLYPEFHPQARVEFMNLAFGSSLKHSDHVITDTETVRQEFIQHFGWSADKVTAIGLGMDAAYHPRSDAELAPVLAKHGLQPRSYALYVGTIEPRKNISRLLQAYEQLDPALRRAFPLVLAGSKGWKSEDVHRRMEQAANEGWLHYLSYVDQADLPMLYAGARLFVYPSLYEGFGLPIVEAMASGTPVLTSDASCMPEVAGGAAALVNPLDVDDILRGLQSHLGDEAWLREASAQGLVRATTYSWQRCAAETLAVYKAL